MKKDKNNSNQPQKVKRDGAIKEQLTNVADANSNILKAFFVEFSGLLSFFYDYFLEKYKNRKRK